MPTILIIDDQQMMRDLIQTVLERNGYDTITATNGRDARRQRAGRIVDGVVTDLFMPEEDGIEVIRELREAGDRMPVIAISGGTERMPGDFLRMATLLGADRVLRKPFRIDELLAALRELLAEKR